MPNTRGKLAERKREILKSLPLLERFPSVNREKGKCVCRSVCCGECHSEPAATNLCLSETVRAIASELQSQPLIVCRFMAVR